MHKLAKSFRSATDCGAEQVALFAASLVVAAFAFLIGTIAIARADNAQYYYDPAGRLTAMVDPVNGSAQYNYDAVGNILSVVRKSITDLMVAQISPSRGAAGTVVTISGTGFGTTANTTVSFNGTSATPSAVSATQITVAVPSGAASGSISVTSPAGSASSGASFAVLQVAAPRISSVSSSPTNRGTTITISGSGFDPSNDKVFVNGRYTSVVSASSTTLTAVVPTATSGYVSVETPNGMATSSNYLVVPPLPYLASNIGSVVNSSIGNSATSNVSTAGQIGLILFDATAGQDLALQVTASSLGSFTLLLYGPDGAEVTSEFVSTGTFVPNQRLTLSGTYTVVVVPSGSSTGSASMTLLNVPPDATATINTDAVPVSLTTTVAGQGVSLPFLGAAGQRISLASQLSSGFSNDGCGNWLYIYWPGGSTQFFNENCVFSGFTDVMTLPVEGAYTLQFVPGGQGTGTATFTLYNVPPDATSTIATDGTPVSLTTTVPGQNMSMTFTGAAGQRIGFLSQLSSGLTNDGCGNGLNILEPDGATQFYSQGCYFSGFSDVLILPVAGTYTIQFNPGGPGVGTATFTLNTVPPDVTGTIAVGGSAVPLTTAAAGQNMSLTFTGTAGQRISLLTQSDAALNSCGIVMQILEPDGTTKLYSDTCLTTSPRFSDVLVLPVAGTYTIQYSPAGTAIGTATFTLNTVPPDVTGTIAVGGSAVPLTTTVAGQNMSLTFTGTAGQRISVLTQSDAALNSCGIVMQILEPDGTTKLYSDTCLTTSPRFSDVLILPVAGTYTIQYSPAGTAIGTATFTLFSVPADASATVTPGGGSVSLTTTTAGQNVTLTFTGTAGQRVSLLEQITSSLESNSNLTILAPNGTTQIYSYGYVNSASTFTDVLVLPSAGTYTIQYNPSGTLIGTATFTLYNIPPDVTGTATVGAAASNYTTTVPGQAIRVSFAGTSGQSVTVHAGVVSATPAAPCYRITTLAPDGTTTVRGDQSCSAGYSSGSLSLPQNGTYTVIVDPNDVAIGTFSAGVTTP